jgi:hypothetical protein
VSGRTLAAVCLGIALAASSSSASAAPIDQAVAAWARHMVEYGARQCAALEDPRLSADDRLAATDYDQMRVMLGIAEYTGQSRWRDCAARARASYRDAYVLANNADVPGDWNFTTGLRLDFERTGDLLSRRAVIKLAETGMYCRDSTPIDSTISHVRSREVASCIVAFINAQALGAPMRVRRAIMVAQAYDHLEQWFDRFQWSGDELAPFMVGLTAHALIRDWEQTRDPRLIPALRRAADWLWAHAWLPSERSMWYRSNDRFKGAPDLNLLVAPMYAFLYRQTGESAYRIAGDQLFEGGVALAGLDGPKQFNQQYWWSFDFVTWRFRG